MKYICQNSCLISSNVLTVICGIWGTYLLLALVGNSNVERSCRVFFHLYVQSIWPVVVVGHTCAMWQPYLFRGICQWCKMYNSAPGHTVDCSDFKWGIYTDIARSYGHIKLICICGILRGLFVTGPYMAVTWSRYCSLFCLVRSSIHFTWVPRWKNLWPLPLLPFTYMGVWRQTNSQTTIHTHPSKN